MNKLIKVKPLLASYKSSYSSLINTDEDIELALGQIPNVSSFQEDVHFFTFDSNRRLLKEIIKVNANYFPQLIEKVPYSIYYVFRPSVPLYALINIFNKYEIETITDIQLYYCVLQKDAIFSFPHNDFTHNNISFIQIYNKLLQQYIYLLETTVLTDIDYMTCDFANDIWIKSLYKILTNYQLVINMSENDQCQFCKDQLNQQEQLSIFIRKFISMFLQKANEDKSFITYLSPQLTNYRYFADSIDPLQQHIYISIPIMFKFITPKTLTYGEKETDQINFCKWIDQLIYVDVCHISSIKQFLFNLLRQNQSIYNLYQSVHSLNLIT